MNYDFVILINNLKYALLVIHIASSTNCMTLRIYIKKCIHIKLHPQ